MRIPEKHDDEERREQQSHAEEDAAHEREEEQRLAPLALLAQLDDRELDARRRAVEQRRAERAQRGERPPEARGSSTTGD
jgi:hypothetical protein